MDQIIEKKRVAFWKTCSFGIGGIVVLVMLYQIVVGASVSTYKVNAEELIISTVKHGVFEEVVPVSGIIEPSKTVFLDAVAGGVVQQVFVEKGSFVEKGQPILQLQNSDLHLNVTRNNTSITEQLNNLSNISNGLETTKLQTERQVIDVRYRIKTLNRDKQRFEGLVKDKLLSEQQYQAVIDELHYLDSVLVNLFKRQKLEDKIRVERVEQIAQQMKKLEENLEISTDSLESLLVRAPISGQLTSFTVEIGESKTRGERLGQIDDTGSNKIVAQIDEYYVSRVQLGQVAGFKLSGIRYQAYVENIYPEIHNGTFEVDLKFGEELPSTIRRGQTLHLELLLAKQSESLLLSNGGFLQDSGGKWVFVLNSAGGEAFRRDVRLGRRNNMVVEVLSGLSAGEKVVTSGYSSMQDVERVKILQ